MSRFQFVDDHRDTYEVKRLCQVLDVNRSSYYKWLAGAEARAARQHKDRVLAEEIREVHGESGGAYGSPRVTAELREKGRRVNEKRVARIRPVHRGREGRLSCMVLGWSFRAGMVLGWPPQNRCSCRWELCTRHSTSMCERVK
ncbi:transposase [Streptomyces sp. ISL-96]|uniref:IS3 family transposase n=1 Tax=Streptomyces sp. ISL-96 TaxID=2819191 RepID=UPI001BEB2B7C|nr:IS3 family transposase [Streptomyces sp. ISL-96]MBT2489207.1 transposase [Streptomyces sp. ISL-96]